MDYVVQPLPVDHMALRMIAENEIELTWQAVTDSLEPTATAEKYIVYTRIGNGDFDNGIVVDKNSYRTALPAGVVCSYKVTALNKGGESFPSEILSAGKAFNSKGTVLVVNGFDRISAPADFVAPAPAAYIAGPVFWTIRPRSTLHQRYQLYRKNERIPPFRSLDG